MKANKKCLWIAFAAVLALCTTLRAAPPLTGAIFTTDSTCTGVNVNIFDNKSDVYLDGGPDHGGSGFPDGSLLRASDRPEWADRSGQERSRCGHGFRR